MSQPVRILLPFTECRNTVGGHSEAIAALKGVANGALKSMQKRRTEALRAFCAAMRGGREAQVVLGLTGRPFQEALATNRGVETCERATVIERAAGAFASALLARPVPAAVVERTPRDVLFICPLLGVLRPGDRVPDYRCPAGANLPRIGSLHHFWKGPVTATLNRLLKDAQVFSFLPARLTALWTPDGRAAGITMLRFSRVVKDRCVGETAAVPRLTGEAVRFILGSGVRDGNGLTAFRSRQGHAYSAAQSDERGGVRRLTFVLDPASAAAAAR